jgi:AraC-like DNA-binding protein
LIDDTARCRTSRQQPNHSKSSGNDSASNARHAGHTPGPDDDRRPPAHGAGRRYQGGNHHAAGAWPHGILWFIARNIEHRGLSAQDASVNLKCSVRTIYNTCAAHGTSFSALVIETRLVAAQYQLIRTNQRISQIAYDVGFSSLSHFSRLFRARFGVTAKTMSAGNRAEITASRQA